MADVKLIWTKLISLKEANVRDIPENTQGVFRLSYTPDDGKNFFVFFVDKSEDIKRELLSYINNHNENICAAGYIKTSTECRYRYAAIDDNLVREAALRQVCKFYQPACNKHVQPSVDENFIINVT